MSEFKKLEHCVYVLLSHEDGKFYIGYTTNLNQRLSDHFRGKNPATAPRRPLQLLFCEYYLSKSDAVRRERYFKRTDGKRALRLMLKDSLTEV